MEKLQKKFDSLQDLKDYCQKLPPGLGVAVIEDANGYWLEDSPAFIRNFEKLLFEGLASQVAQKL